MQRWTASDLDGARVGILGFGREGRAALAWLRREAPGARVMVLDERSVAVPPGVAVEFGSLRELPLGRCDLLIRSPGISIHRPELAAARRRGLPITSGSSLFLASPDRPPVAAITGTKGKSTVSALAAHLLESAGRRVALAGNIGTPLLEIAPGSADLVIAELSSYQVADLIGTPEIALLTNLFPEHLDWHGDEDTYYREKCRLIELAGQTALVNARSALAVARTEAHPRHRLYNSASGLRVEVDGVWLAGRRVAERPEWSLRGRHNLDNLEAALAVALAAGEDPGALAPAARSFRALAHRQEVVWREDGIRYVDDSIATTPHATLAALEAFGDGPIAVIVGGHDRGLDWRAFADRLRREPVAIVLVRGDNGPRILDSLTALAPAQPVLAVAGLAEAVVAARASLPRGGTVLLSPGAPSFGEFRDYAERGEAFSALCRSPAS